MGGISIWQLLIVLAIVALLFGTKKLRGIGGDLGGAIRGFKKAISDEDQKSDDADDTDEGKETASLQQQKQQKEQAQSSDGSDTAGSGKKSKSRH